MSYGQTFLHFIFTLFAVPGFSFLLLHSLSNFVTVYHFALLSLQKFKVTYCKLQYLLPSSLRHLHKILLAEMLLARSSKSCVHILTLLSMARATSTVHVCDIADTGLLCVNLAGLASLRRRYRSCYRCQRHYSGCSVHSAGGATVCKIDAP